MIILQPLEYVISNAHFAQYLDVMELLSLCCRHNSEVKYTLTTIDAMSDQLLTHSLLLTCCGYRMTMTFFQVSSGMIEAILPWENVASKVKLILNDNATTGFDLGLGIEGIHFQGEAALQMKLRYV
jgi:hypothetical protein